MTINKKIKKWLFLRKLNNRIKPLNAKATIILEGKTVDILQITIINDGNEQFTQLRIGEYNYTHYLIEDILKQIELKKAKENN